MRKGVVINITSLAGFRGKMISTWRPHGCRLRLLFPFIRFSQSTLPHPPPPPPPPPPPLTVDTAESNYEEGEGGYEEKAVGKQKLKEERVSLPPVPLPPLLGEALRTVLSNYPPKSLITAGSLISEYIFRDTTVTPPIKYSRRLSIGYAASRTQPVYGSTYRVLHELANIDKGFKPETMLDYGSGLGTAVWAVHSVWGNSVYEYQTIDTSSDMGDLARSLRNGGSDWAYIIDSSLSACPAPTTTESIKGVYFRQYLPVSSKVKYDLVVSAYSLSELSTPSLWKQALLSLWGKTEKYLVLIEHGTSSGFDIISQARDFLLNGGNNDQDKCHVVAPCPHDLQCPKATDDYYRVCKFAQRVAIPFTEYTRCRPKGFYIESFSYLILKKGERPQQFIDDIPCRLLLPTKKRTKHIICELCCPNGKAVTLIFSKAKQRELLRTTRKKAWGDTVIVPQELYDKQTNDNNNNLNDIDMYNDNDD